MKTNMIRAVVGVMALCVALPVFAHHSGGMFDDTRQITVSGIVREFQYTNPHSWLLVDVKGDDGKVTTWGFEAEGPSTLTRAGLRKSDFKPGTPITMTGDPMRDGRPAGTWFRAIRTSDNKEFSPRGGFAVK